VAISYLVRRLEENAAPQNFLYALFGDGLAGPEERFRASVKDRHEVPDAPRRTQDRTAERPDVLDLARPGFRNVPDTDPSLPVNQAWAAAARSAPLPPSTGRRVTDAAGVDEVVRTARAAAGRWAGTSAEERAAVLRRCASELQRARAALLTAMAAEGGKTLAEADPEVSEAVDFAEYYAGSALALGEEPGATFTPAGVVVVTPPWNFPVAIPLGGVLAALAAGCAVVIKPAPQTPVCAELGVAALHAAGVPPDVLQLVHTGEGAAGRRLVTHPDVGAVVLTGSGETAALFRDWRPDLRLFAETSGKNAIVVTPAADLDLAVADVVRSAFGHAGQKCSAASLLICVGSVARSDRFRRQLRDAVTSLRVGPATVASTTMGPLIEAPSPRLERALTTLERGQRWLVRPRHLGGTRWTPGVVDGVRPGSFLHRTEVFGPVLAVLAAPDLDTAIAWQNGTGHGLTGGLHSLDEREIAHWLARVEVGNAYVNRHITGAVVRRQPFGGWKGSVVGPGAKAGGPNYVAQLGRWADGDLTELPVAEPGPAARRVLALQPSPWLEAAAGSDQAAWEEQFNREHDPSALAAEANPLRYRPLPVLLVRTGPGRRSPLLRVLLAAARTGTHVQVSTPGPLDLPPLPGVGIHVEDDAALAARLAAPGRPERLRALVPLPEGVLRAAAASGVSVLDDEPVASGRRELLTVLREQSISRTLHRFGHLPAGG
jgi:RHH-type proline utilization regulon transcriptional repressor/proline dehydrogenase/delta 1-pyrroline-5-carboxylate dehydrogenase